MRVLNFHFQPVKKTVTLSKDPNVVQSQDEEDQIAKAIELSLKESKVTSSPRSSTATKSLYPSVGNLDNASGPSRNMPQKEIRKVRALYDFEAAEDNELTFNAGELIIIIDDSDPCWWKGSNHRGEGLFPTNFVTTDLNMEPKMHQMQLKKTVDELNKDVVKRLEEDTSTACATIETSKEDVVVPKEPDHVEIDEDKINRLLHLLHEADPTNPDQDTEEMLILESK